MQHESISRESTNHVPGASSLSARTIFLLILRNWIYYPIALVVLGAGAYLFLKYKIPTYRIETTLLIEEPSNNQQAAEDLLEGFAVRPGVQNLDNQILIISSYTIVRRTLEELPFQIDVYRKGLFSWSSYYPLSPLRIEAGEGGLPFNQEFVFEYEKENQYHLTSTRKATVDVDTVLRFGQTMRLREGSFIIRPQPELEEEYKSGKRIYIGFYDKDRLTDAYRSRLIVENATRDGSIVRLTLMGTNIVKDIIFLDKLTEVYINNNLEKKNREAKRIIDFIDGQLVSVQDSLMITETQLQEFRSRNQIMDVSAQAQQIIDQAVVLENEKARLSLEKSYFEYLDDYLATEDNDKAPAPASMGIENPLLNSLLQELAGLQAQYITSGAGERNPLQGQLEARIRTTKESIKEALSGIKLANQMALDENANQIQRLNSRASGLPVKERQLLGFERQFNLNNVLYNFLLQRRADAQIQKASNAPDHELVDPARAFGPIAPLATKVLAIALALALLLPTTVIILGNTFQNKISSEEDVRLLSQSPIIAHFPHSRLSYNTVVLNEPNSRISEAFRSLRTRMEYFTNEAKCPLILVSSSMPGEGKTFAAINLASAYSLAGKKTVLIGFDLRRPTLSRSFELGNDNGMTNYLIGKKSLTEIIQRTEFDNLDVIPSGPIPPNPGELSSTSRVKEMVTALKKKYDYIVVDSAPVGIVSDIYTLASIADAVLLITRHGFTKKHILRATLTEMKSIGIHGLSLIINDVKSRGNHYSYSYKYKYEYADKSKKGKWRS